MANELEVINEALVRLGVPPVASLADRTAQALTASTISSNVRKELLADHPWSFALREARLPQIVLPESELRFSGYKYTYQLPTDYIRVLGLQERTPYRLAGNQLYTDAKSAYLVYVADVDPPSWPAYFRHVVVLQLAATFALTLTESSNRADLFYREARQARARARSIDSQQTPTFVYDLMRVYTRRSVNPLTQP